MSLWLILATSSFPLHMIWNSVVLETHQANAYVAITITDNFTEGADWTIPPFATYTGGPQLTVSHDGVERLQQQAQNKSLEWLSAESCIKKYSEDLTYEYGDVLIVVNTSTYVPSDPT
ncbi:uncharacterized protein N7479_003021 [Penicillium vulpinum]|uniref:DUF6536 domain-containing protein n=1 Tax=Penicillium vulpinum TaxID=29845 RepID=A0A1V6RGC1_9EURO|nr:uncharacterized protein N7479_003021 [Penicillium vulpinum]KAJ5973103.1 hypothetical protein N7479_003021 [Penicillium vulpinum]OQE00489.1 hypothetical protein PENVUL_c051G06548 [Penicillium vulpinum]